MYLISIAVANRVKDKFYTEDLPNLEDVRDITLLSVLVNSSTTTQSFRERHSSDLDVFLGTMTPEELQTRLVDNCANVLLQAQTIQVSHQEVLKDRLVSVTVALEEIQPHKDQNLFIDLNFRPFSLPSDWNFEPCTSHYDTVRYCIPSVASGSQHSPRMKSPLILPRRCFSRINWLVRGKS